jgi:hypothetical protein
VVELSKQVTAVGRQFDFLPQVNLSEFKDAQLLYSLENCSKVEFRAERMRRYRSPFLLSIPTLIKDKYDAILAADVAFALVHTFQDEHRMLSHNLLNMHLSEELKEALPSVILVCIYSLIIGAQIPHTQETIYYAVLMNSLAYNAKAMDAFKKFKSQSEDIFVSGIFSNIHLLTPTAVKHTISYMATFLSQIAGKDLGQAEPILLKLMAGSLNDDQSDFLRGVFAQLSRLCFQKKVKDQLDVQFHTYMPPETPHESPAVE